MFLYRYITLVVVFGISLAGITAAMKMTEPSPNTARFTDVVERYSGGDETPVSIDESFFQTPVPIQESEPTKQTPKLPDDVVAAEGYIVGDLNTGEIYLEKNISKVFPFASMTKLITAFVATNLYSSSTLLEVTPADTEVSTDSAGLVAGEKLTTNELLYPLLLESSNVAAETLASSADRIKFMELMSSYAWEIGMPQSFFSDPSGLSQYNGGTASGFFAMARYLYSDRQDILAITRTPHIFLATTTVHGSHDLSNIHPFVKDPRFLGGKTGHTSFALDTMLTILKIAGRPIGIIVLRSPYERERDTKILADKVSAILAGSD